MELKIEGIHAGQGHLKVYRGAGVEVLPPALGVVEKRGALSCLLEALGRQDSYRWELSSDFTDCQHRCEDEQNRWAFAGGATHAPSCKLTQATRSGLLLFKAVSDKVSSSLCLLPLSARKGWSSCHLLQLGGMSRRRTSRGGFAAPPLSRPAVFWKHHVL